LNHQLVLVSCLQSYS